MPELRELCLRGNQVRSLAELKYLRILNQLRSFDLCGNPIFDNEEFRRAVWSYINNDAEVVSLKRKDAEERLPVQVWKPVGK